MARSVGGALGRRRGLSLPELQRAAFSEMMRHVRGARGGRTVVPTRYLVRLHPDDAATVEAAPRFFTAGLAEALRSTCKEHGWQLDGAVSVDVEGDSSRLAGAPAVLAVPPEGPLSASPAPPPDMAPTVPARARAAPLSSEGGERRMLLHRLDTDERISLGPSGVTIGREANQDIVIADSRVSRHHAVVRADGSGWAVVDDGSSNGTRLNGSAIAATCAMKLQAGDSIEIGPVRLRFDVDDRPRPARRAERSNGADDPPTMTLDAATRRRISAEHLGSDDERRRADPGRDEP